MKPKYICLFLILLTSRVESASLLEKSYDYVLNLSKSIAPSLMSLIDCLTENDTWSCAKEKAGKMLDHWNEENDQRRLLWQEAADKEAATSGRSMEEMPSRLGREVEASLNAVTDLVRQGMARALSRHHHDSGSETTITVASGGGDKKKGKKKKKKPTIHLHPMMMKNDDQRAFGNVQSWVIGKNVESSGENAMHESVDQVSDDSSILDEKPGDLSMKKDDSSLKSGDSSLTSGDSSMKSRDSSLKSDSSLQSGDSSMKSARKGRDIVTELWSMGQKAMDAVAEHAIDSDTSENGIEDKSSFEEQRGKKKKKKKAILKLLILGAVLKAKIGTLLQILSFKLQVKFFLIALIGLGINLARFWLDLKKQHAPPQKVIYYEHAQHQHHYDHEEEPGWGPWSRSMEPEESDSEVDASENTPYRSQVDRNVHLPYQAYGRPVLTRV